MPISSKVSHDIQFLNDVDAANCSIGLSGEDLKQVQGRSRFCNFLHWIVHIITFTLVPQNRKLDQITLQIINEIQDELEDATTDEKDLADKAIRNLRIVIQNNGGSHDDAIKKLLATIAKIQTLPEVKNLIEKGAEQEDDLSPKGGKQEDVLSQKERDQKNESLEEEIFDDLLDAQEQKPIDKKDKQKKEIPNTKEIKPNELRDSEENQEPSPSFAINFEETRLQDLLQNLIDQKLIDDYEAKKSIMKLLPELKGSVLLSDDLLTVLDTALKLDRFDLHEKLSPELLICIVKNCLENANLCPIVSILNAMKYSGSFEKGHFVAFAYGFKLYHDNLLDNQSTKEIPTKQMSSFLFGCSADGKKSFVDYLSENEMKGFIGNILDLVIAQTTDHSKEKVDNFNTAIWLRKKFGTQYEQVFMDTFCQMNNAHLLILLCKYEKTMPDVAIKGILEANPPKASDPDDLFFQNFVEEAVKEMDKILKDMADDTNKSLFKGIGLRDEEDFVNKLADYVFANECLERQKFLASKLSPGIIIMQLKNIPTEAWEEIHDSTLLDVTKKLVLQRPAPADSELQAYAKALDANHLYDFIDQTSFADDFIATIFPSCAVSVQVEFISRALDSGSLKHRWALEKIPSDLDPKIWEKASEQNTARNYSDIRGKFTPEVLAHIVNGQVNNQKFHRDFFEQYFKKGGDLEEQKDCVAHLKPDVFEFDKPADISHATWYQFFKALREIPDQGHAQSLLIQSTLNLFDSPGLSWVKKECIYALPQDQMKLLPIHQYKSPTIRLLLGCLTGQLDDTLLATANSLYDQQGGMFFEYFEGAYQTSLTSQADLERLYSFAYKKDPDLLKDFLLWVLDRPSITPALATWTWIKEFLPGSEILLSMEVQSDMDIMGHVRRLHLTIPPKKRSGW